MSSMVEFDIDPELLAGFVDEAEEGLATLDSLFVALEADPSDIDTINAIFRPVHTIKGNSAFFGLMKVKELAHEMETLLSMAKDNKLVPDQLIISILLSGIDKLKEMLSNARDGQTEIEDDAQFRKLVQQVIDARELKCDTDELWNELFNKCEKLKNDITKIDLSYADYFEAIIKMAVQIRHSDISADGKTKETGTDMAQAIPEPLLNLKSILDKQREAGFTEEESNAVQKCLTELADVVTSKPATDILQSILDEYENIAQNGGVGDALIVASLTEKVKTLISLDEWQKPPAGSVPNNEKTESETIKEKTKPATANESRKTIRVAEDSIDNFLEYVGELIITGEMYNHLQKRTSKNSVNSKLAGDFKQVNETFSNLSDNLQKSIMDIRKVPVRNILQKAPRMARDIATSTGKQIKIELIGEDIKVDKRLIETLDAPLTHMVRNAADHGIEMPDARQAAGKQPHGSICVAITETADDVMLTISDDGKGLNIEAIKAKAVKLGIIEPDQEMTHEKVVDLLFASGVSTAEKVTDVSGRGVGMDVVKRNIDTANGKIAIKTELGQGTEFVIKLPRTVSTQIVDGLLVKHNSGHYVIPMDKVLEVFHPAPQDINSIANKNESVLRHNKLLSVIKLEEIFGNTTYVDKDNNDGIMIAINSGKNKAAIYVDEIVGIQKVVLKQLEGIEFDCQLYSAVAVMGDGTTAMVLDIDSLMGITMNI